MSTWDKRINNVAQRFRVLNAFNNEAVLDRETGLCGSGARVRRP